MVSGLHGTRNVTRGTWSGRSLTVTRLVPWVLRGGGWTRLGRDRGAPRGLLWQLEPEGSAASRMHLLHRHVPSAGHSPHPPLMSVQGTLKQISRSLAWTCRGTWKTESFPLRPHGSRASTVLREDLTPSPLVCMEG